MKKEVAISIVIGFVIGLVVTFGIYTAQKSLRNSEQIQSPQADETAAPSPTISIASQSLSLSAPLDQSITKETKVIVSGNTVPEVPVMILYEKGEKLIVSDKKGNFETEIPLDSGENEIEVQAILDSGEKVTKTVTVVYTTAEI